MFSESASDFSPKAMVLALITLWAFEAQGKDYVSKLFSLQLFTAKCNRSRWENLDRFQYRFQLIKFVNSVVEFGVLLVRHSHIIKWAKNNFFSVNFGVKFQLITKVSTMILKGNQMFTCTRKMKKKILCFFVVKMLIISPA